MQRFSLPNILLFLVSSPQAPSPPPPPPSPAGQSQRRQVWPRQKQASFRWLRRVGSHLPHPSDRSGRPLAQADPCLPACFGIVEVWHSRPRQSESPVSSCLLCPDISENNAQVAAAAAAAAPIPLGPRPRWTDDISSLLVLGFPRSCSSPTRRHSHPWPHRRCCVPVHSVRRSLTRRRPGCVWCASAPASGT